MSHLEFLDGPMAVQNFLLAISFAIYFSLVVTVLIFKNIFTVFNINNFIIVNINNINNINN